MTAAQPVRNSEIVRSKIALFDRRLGHTAHLFWSHPQFPQVYREYIYQSHSIIRASVPLMQAAEKACQLPQHACDPALEGFGRYLRHHIPEEIGHHEWIVNDGVAMGLDRQDILQRLPKESATQLVGVQYYWIHHYSPIALAGFIATMEGSPPPAEFFQAVAARNNLSLKCFSSFLYHAKIDPQHRKDLDAVLDALPLTPAQLELIGISSLRTIRMMTGILEDIIETGASLKTPPTGSRLSSKAASATRSGSSIPARADWIAARV